MPLISAIVPARNEEQNISACISSLAQQKEIAEIIVVDDQSSDRTPEILLQLQAQLPKLKIFSAGQLPRGWTGKNHALWLGAEAASGAWLLFTDADTTLLPGALRRAMEDACSNQASLTSYSPEQLVGTFFERALIPFIYVRLARIFDFSRVNDPNLPDVAANGQFILIRRDVYWKCGGHRAISGCILEDVALAQRVKTAGFRIYFAPGQGVARTRMYRNFMQLWQGWTKNLYLLVGGRAAKAAREIALTFPWWILLLLTGWILDPGGAALPLLFVGIAAFVLQHGWYARNLRANRYSARLIVYYSFAALLYAALILSSGWKVRRGKICWKGREYPVPGPSADR